MTVEFKLGIANYVAGTIESETIVVVLVNSEVTGSNTASDEGVGTSISEVRYWD